MGGVLPVLVGYSVVLNGSYWVLSRGSTRAGIVGFCGEHHVEQRPKEVFAGVAFDAADFAVVLDQYKGRGKGDFALVFYTVGGRVMDIGKPDWGEFPLWGFGVYRANYAFPFNAVMASALFYHNQFGFWFWYLGGSLCGCFRGGQHGKKQADKYA